MVAILTFTIDGIAGGEGGKRDGCAFTRCRLKRNGQRHGTQVDSILDSDVECLGDQFDIVCGQSQQSKPTSTE